MLNHFLQWSQGLRTKEYPPEVQPSAPGFGASFRDRPLTAINQVARIAQWEEDVDDLVSCFARFRVDPKAAMSTALSMSSRASQDNRALKLAWRPSSVSMAAVCGGHSRTCAYERSHSESCARRIARRISNERSTLDLLANDQSTLSLLAMNGRHSIC